MKDKKEKKTVVKVEYRENKYGEEMLVYIDEKIYLPIPKKQYDKIVSSLHIDSLEGKEVVLECGCENDIVDCPMDCFYKISLNDQKFFLSNYIIPVCLEHEGE